MNSIQLKFDYTKYNPEVLMKLFSTFKNESSYENRRDVIMSIIYKYVENNKSFNIYAFLSKNIITSWNKKELIEVLSKAINVEFVQNVVKLPKEYREDFFVVLISFLDSIDKLVVDADDVEITWELYNIPTLMDYLSSAHTLKIDDITLRAKINNLVEKIKKSYEEFQAKEKTKEEIKQELMTVSNIVNIEQLESFKPMVLKKSGLTQIKLEEAMKNFSYLNDKDRIYLLDYMIKKKWTYASKYTDSIVFFDFLMFKLGEISENRFMYCSVFNPFRLLQYSLSNELVNWLNYFGVSNLKNAFEKIKEIYFSFIGATDNGWTGFLRSIVILGVKNYKGIENENEFFAEYRSMLLDECYEEITEILKKGYHF